MKKAIVTVVSFGLFVFVSLANAEAGYGCFGGQGFRCSNELACRQGSLNRCKVFRSRCGPCRTSVCTNAYQECYEQVKAMEPAHIGEDVIQLRREVLKLKERVDNLEKRVPPLAAPLPTP